MKRKSVWIILLLLLTAAASFAYAQTNNVTTEGIKVFIDGSEVTFPDQEPYIDNNNRLMVPLRFCLEALGAEVNWDDSKQEISILRTKEDNFTLNRLSLKIGEKQIFIHPDIYKEMDTAAVIINDRTIVPLRFVAEAFDCRVIWDNSKQTAYVFTGQLSKSEEADILDKAGLEDKLPRIYTAQNMQRLLDESPQVYNSYSKQEAVAEVIIDEANQNMPNIPAPRVSMDKIKVDYSDTNIQVEGVDEADIVKTDGEYIYQLNNNELLIIKAYPASELKVLSRMELKEIPREIYIDENRLITISNSYHDYYIMDKALPIREKRLYPPQSEPENKVIINNYDIGDKSNPAKISSYKMEGNYLSSRKIDNKIYFISNEMICHPYEPSYYVNDNKIVIPYADIRYFPNITHNSYLHIAQLDTQANEQFNVESFLTSGQEIYCSKNNLYVTAEEYNPQYRKNRDDGSSTIIYKFELDKGLHYSAKAAVSGSLLNQFSMDEYDKYFRIATTRNAWSREDSRNDIYIMDADLQIVSSIKDIAPGEKIYSARFMGDRAYLVTFRQLDPFFVIDLNPDEPKILGKLKLPGFSDYLHPYKDNYIVGLGYDTVDEKRWGIRKLGIKMSLFDVSNVENPLEVDSVIIGSMDSCTEATSNHKAFMLYKDIVSFPATVYETIDSNYHDASFSFQGAYMYQISEKGFNFKGRVSHLDKDDYLRCGDYWCQSNDDIRRILYIGTNLYTISNNQIKAFDANSLQNIGKINT